MDSIDFTPLAARLLFIAVILVLPFGNAARADEVDSYIKSEMADFHIPGLSLAVVRDGRIIKAQAYGLANVELNVPATADTEFSIASMTKSVTASAVMLLVQDGKINLDDPISKYFEGLPESWQPITVRHLLTHTSGIKDHFHDYPFFPIAKLDRKLEYTDAEYLKALIDGDLNFKPGAQWAYSGTGFTLLGMIIKKVTGKPYADFLRERIFTPLGMTRTHVISLAEIIPNRASGYSWRKGALNNGSYTGQTMSGGADVSLLTTAADLAKWHIALSSEGLWKQSSLDQMWTPAVLSNGQEAVPFPQGASGLGWALGIYKGHQLIGHGGTFITGFTSFMGRIPDKRLIVIVLTNQYDAAPWRLAFGVAGLYEPDLLAPHRMTTQPDAQPELTTKVKAFITALFSGGAIADPATFVTPGLRNHLPPIPKLPAGEKSLLTDLSFITSEDISQRGIERRGARLAQMRYYRAKFEDDIVYLTFYFTKDGEIADYSGY
jgi:CubicO group peptidase (beta-lactamase class C family)